VGEEDRWVLASRVAIGLMGPAGRDDIPADLRFYSGGGGSLRGYGYQLAGPLDANDNPLGGRSLFEAAVEMRYRASETIGLAAFVDSGTVYDSMFPDFSEELRVGAGVGLRYYTPLGPFRFDVAMPVNGRDADSSFQVYLSIGQAF
jgi:translocation and assembly module TamA